jgi:hypothetical protein
LVITAIISNDVRVYTNAACFLVRGTGSSRGQRLTLPIIIDDTFDIDL